MRRVVLLALFALLVLPHSSAAQDMPRFGIVMGYPAQVALLWKVSDRLAVRPELNWSRLSSETISTADILTFPPDAPVPFTTTSEGWAVGTGVSALVYLVKGDALRTYVSPRFTYTRSSTSLDLGFGRVSTSTTTSSTYGVAGLFGAQYKLANRFGVFGEMGFGYSRGTGSPGSSGITRSESTSTSVGFRSGAGVILFFGS
jgi:hypothetical protein